jgi:hypothetical protein
MATRWFKEIGSVAVPASQIRKAYRSIALATQFM